MNQTGRLQQAVSLVETGQLADIEEPRHIIADLVVGLSAIQSLIVGQTAFRRAFAGKVYSIRRARNGFFPEDLF